MAKKDDFDDIGFDDVDWDDFDEPPRQNNGKSRNPILDTAKQVRKSALATIWPRGKRDQVILKGMPQPASEAYKGYQDAKGVAKDVYAHTKDEIIKTERLVKQQARQLGPTLKRYLPDSLTNRINKWARTGEETQYGAYDQQQAGLDRMMGEVFGAGQQQTEEQQTEARETATEDRLRDAVREMKSDALMNTVLGIARDVHMQTGLSKGVFLNIERKKLELQYRTLFALQDIAKLKQTEFDRNTPALEAIVKNTALPDYAKEEFSEIHWANIKRKAAEWMNPLRYGEEFMNNVRDNMTKKISQAFGDGRMALEMLMGSAVEDDFGMEDSSSLSPDSRKKNGRDKGVGWLTSFLTKKLIGPQLAKVQGKTKQWLEDRPEYMSKLHQAQFKARGWTQGTISNSSIAGEEEGTAANVFRMGRDFGIINPMGREKGFLDARDGEALNRVAKFDRRAHLALVEVIPAWLSEINKSIRRGYGEHADQEYDITTRGFTSRRQLSDRIRKGVADDKGRVKQQENIWEIVNYLDDKKTLSEKDRQGLANYLESRISLGRSMNVDSILKDSNHLMRYMPSNTADRVVDLLRAKSDGMTGGAYELSNALEDKFSGARSAVKGYQKNIDEATAIYGERALRDAGIFRYDKKNDTFDIDKDFADPFTLFNDTRMGKTRSGKALTLEQEIQKKLKGNSALADLLRRKFNNGGDEDDPLAEGSPLGGGPKGGGGGGKGRGKGMSPVQLARVLYGETETNFVDLLKGTNSNDGTETDRIVEAVRGINLNSLTTIQEKILSHVKSMDEQGVLLASLAGGEGGGDGTDEMGPPRPGAGPRRRRIVLGETGLLRRWGGILADTAGGAFNLGKRGVLGAKDRLGKFGGWVRGKFGGPSTGPSMFERMKGLVTGGVGGAFNSALAFGQGLLGIKDIFNEQGKVVLQGSKLEAGEYYQMSSNGQGAKPVQLKTLDDIRLGRDIIDSEGNIILSAADLASAGKLSYYKGGKIQSLFQAIARKGGEFGNKVLGAPKRILDKIAPRFKSAREWFTNIPDIYVKGDTQPRLYANLMRQGHYINVASKQPVYKVEDITGPIDDINGNNVISASELQNPEFKLVDKWGRPVKSPLGRIVGRIGRIAGWGRDLIMGIPGRLRAAGSSLKNMALNNPIANWFKGGGKGGGFLSGNTLFGGMGTGRKTNHILIRIYKLLNQRLAGEPEDDSWTEEMEKGTGGSKSLERALRKGKVAGRLMKRRFRNRFGGRINSGRSWLGGKRDALKGWFGRLGGRANNVLDSFRGAEHDIGTRYEIEKHLLGRDDDVAAFYRDRLHRRGGISKAKVRSAVMDDVEEAKDAAGNVINTGRKKVQSVGARVLDRLNKMVDLQEVTWFNTMRSSLENNGAGEGFVRGMMSKFSRRVKFNSGGEKRDYFQWFRRRRGEHDDGAAAGSGGGGKGKGKGIMDFFKSLPLVGPLVSVLGSVAGILGTVAKWGIFKPGAMLAKGAWGIGKFAVTQALPFLARSVIMPVVSAAGAVVTAVGWPVILAVGAIVGTGIAAYRIATSTYTSYLDTMRIAQYGYRDYDKWSSEDGAKVRYLEDQLKQFIAFNGEGQATCRGLGGKEVQSLAEGYGLNIEEKGEMLAFQAHMLQRFIPVYLRWLTTLKAMDRDIQLSEVGDAAKVTKEEMLAIYEKTALTKDAVQLRALEDPRKVNQGFMSKAWDTVTFTSPQFLDASEVIEVQEDTLREIKKRIDTKKNRKMRTLLAKGQEVTGVKDAFAALNTMDADTEKNYVKKEGWEDGTESITIQVDALGTLNQRDVDALESVRMKTYGLKNLDSGYVAMLKEMEKFVLPFINTKTGSYNGKWTEATDIVAPQVWQTPRGDSVHHWFVNRFLPTFMFYVCGFKRYDPAGDPLNVKMTGGYLYELGLLTSRAYNMRAGIRQSVWEVALVPWSEDGANTDPNSVEKELITLKELSKQADLNIRNLLNEKKVDNKKIAQWQSKDKRTHIYETKDDIERSTYTPEEQAKMNNANGFGGSGFTGIPNDIADNVNAVGGVSKYAQLSTGNVAINLGDVAEGNYKELVEKYPISSLNNTENVKKMIIDVANSMGVPPGVALGMAYAESKFNYKAKNPYASAAGLFQFVNGTWDGMMGKYANNFGIPGTLSAGRGQYDPHANAILGLQFIRDNIKSAQKDLGGKAPPPAVAYLYHFLGAGGGRQFLQAWQKNPNAPATAAASVTRKVLAGNKNVFFTKTGKMRTLNEVMQELNGRMGSVTANSMNADPKLTKELTGGLSPQSSSPAVTAGAAANDPSIGGAAGAANDLPADNAARRDEALATKGTMGADDALAGAGGGSVPGGGGTAGGSDVSNVGDTVEGQAKADGLSDADAAKVRAAAEQRAQAAKSAQGAPAPTSDVSAAGGGLGTGTVGEQQLAVQKEMRTLLTEMRDMMKSGGSLQTGGGNQTPPAKQQPQGSYTQPTPSLDVSRKAS
ncbi:hypothetical protein pEaSNUABM9_00119 [Erwinia phage pEa_SNUABM_9]|nr:hypothetical protein pEaSNUABM9_00119 [Erwinia phage pEa_SNUABM_9]